LVVVDTLMRALGFSHPLAGLLCLATRVRAGDDQAATVVCSHACGCGCEVRRSGSGLHHLTASWTPLGDVLTQAYVRVLLLPQASDYTPNRLPPLGTPLNAARPTDLTAYNQLAANPATSGGLLAGVLALPDVKACLAKCKDRSKRLSTIHAILYPIVVLLVLPKEQVCSAAVPAVAVGFQ
jgi:hypothetical protein